MMHSIKCFEYKLAYSRGKSLSVDVYTASEHIRFVKTALIRTCLTADRCPTKF